MNLSKLILTIGDENVSIQNLDQCSISFDYNIKKGTKITFGTEQRLTPEGTEKLGMILWLDREAVKAAIAEERALSPASDTTPTTEGAALAPAHPQEKR